MDLVLESSGRKKQTPIPRYDSFLQNTSPPVTSQMSAASTLDALSACCPRVQTISFEVSPARARTRNGAKKKKKKKGKGQEKKEKGREKIKIWSPKFHHMAFYHSILGSARHLRGTEREKRDMAAQHAVIAMQIPELHPSPGTFELMRPGGGPLASIASVIITCSNDVSFRTDITVVSCVVLMCAF
jgi:hypothetical protein